jgi:undecaprenyl-diphosphatase
MEERILLWIHSLSHPVWDGLFLVSHHVGTLLGNAVLIAAMALWHARRGERHSATVWVLLGLTTLFLDAVLKPLVGRPRPQLWPWLVSVGPHAFPSGHALAAATFYPLAAFSLRRVFPRSAPKTFVVAGLLALWVGIGRLYLGVHWPSDVLAGWLLGLAQLGVGVHLMRQRASVDP